MLEVNGLPNTNKTHSVVPYTKNFNVSFSEHKPKILLLYGSLRARSYSKLVIEESARLLTYFGAEVKIFNPEGLPQTDRVTRFNALSMAFIYLQNKGHSCLFL